ncbi:MAG: peptidylprolyl isomerase [Rhodospirillaceae bacterium]|nr:peptidylprolyl isomerase [Rhodospirillaceae bacterium]
MTTRLAFFALILSIMTDVIAVADDTWRPLDAANTLVLETSRGAIITELRPEFAPQGVERIKLLAHEGVYDGLLFHRVIDGFVAQTGNPNNRDGGVSSHPDLAPEFTFRLETSVAHTLVTQSSAAITGFVETSPFQGEAWATEKWTNKPPRAWGAYCPGVMGMGRQEGLGTANSEIFFMREAARRLDHTYTVAGMIISGLDVVRALEVGEPPAKPDRINRARMVEDMPATERPRLEVMNTKSAAFGAMVPWCAGRVGLRVPIFLFATLLCPPGLPHRNNTLPLILSLARRDDDQGA